MSESKPKLQRASSWTCYVKQFMGGLALLSFTTFVLWFGGIVSTTHLKTWYLTLAIAELREVMLGDVLTHMSLVGLIYLMMLAMALWVMRRRRPRAPKFRQGAVRGTVLVETLIVFPVLLTLIFGLIQLAMNSSAGSLTQLAAFQASRAYSVWAPEPIPSWYNNLGIPAFSALQTNARARAAAAMAVAPSVYVATGSRMTPDCARGDFQVVVNGIYESNFPGTASQSNIEGLVPPASTLVSASVGLDKNTGFRARAVLKAAMAYCLVEVRHSSSNQTMTVMYHHQAIMPLVKMLFGTPRTIHGRRGYFSTIERTVPSFSVQSSPNRLGPNDAIY